MTLVSELSRGSFIRYQGEVARVEDMQHRTPGNLRAFYQLKMRNTRTGKIIENRFRPNDNIEMLSVETKLYQYLYEERDYLVCMDNQTFEQVYLDEALLGNSLKYLKENTELTIVFEQGKTPITVEMPSSVILKVTYTEPGLTGDTVTRSLKPAEVETGAEVKVPLFVNIGDSIKIDTVTGAYLERVK